MISFYQGDDIFLEDAMVFSEPLRAGHDLTTL